MRRLPAAILVALILLLQWPLWFGKGCWLKVRHERCGGGETP
jgi:cell division protein FtsB